MSSIAEGQKKAENVDLADRVKEAKSKVFADFRPPIIRNRNSTPEHRQALSDAGKISRSNSSMSTRPATMSPRSNSTMSTRGDGSNMASR